MLHRRSLPVAERRATPSNFVRAGSLSFSIHRLFSVLLAVFVALTALSGVDAAQAIAQWGSAACVCAAWGQLNPAAQLFVQSMDRNLSPRQNV